MKKNGDKLSHYMLLAGVFAPMMMLVIVIALGKITPGYNPISDSISQLGARGRPYAAVLNGGYATYGILMGLAAYGLCRSISSPETAKKAAVLLGIHVIFTPLLGVFPDTLDLSAKSFTDDFIHNAVSAIAYVPVLTGILLFRKAARQEKALRIDGIVGLMVVATNLLMPVIGIIEPFKPIGGLLQRLLAASTYLWVASMFYLLHRKLCRMAKESDVAQVPVVSSIEGARM